MQSIDVALANFSKRCRFVTPIPDHLREEVDATSSRMMLLSSTGASDLHSPKRGFVGEPPSSMTSHVVKQLPWAEKLAQQRARDDSRDAVPQLERWLQSISHTKEVGEHSLKEAKFLSTQLQSMNDVTVAVRQQNDVLSANASTLIVRKTRLEAVQQTLQKNIRNFTRVEDLAREVSHPMLSALTARFPVLLEDMEETMQFLSNHHYMKSAASYASNLAMAQQRALLCLRDFIGQAFTAATNVVGNHALYGASFYEKKNVPLFVANSHSNGSQQSAAGRSSGSPEEEEAVEEFSILRFVPLLATLNDVFLAELDNTASLRRLAETRCLSLEDDVHLGDILATYREIRLQLLAPLIRDWLQMYDTTLTRKAAAARAEEQQQQQEPAQTSPPSGSLREVSQCIATLLQGVLKEERTMYERLWLREDVVATFDTLFAKDLSEEFYHHFRSRLIRCDRLDELSLTIDAFQTLLREDNLGQAGTQYETVLKKMLQDTQERVVFRTSVFLRTNIAGRKFTVADATLLLDSAQNGKQHSEEEHSAVEDHSGAIASSHRVVPLHPCLVECLGFLDMLYGAVDRNVFNVFAEECVHMTLVQLAKLASVVAQQRSERYPLAPLHARLVHLAHLLALREGIVHYDANLSVVEKSLDLSQLAQRRLEILQSSREAKKDIETDLRRACEEVIDTTSREAIDAVKRLLLVSSRGGGEDGAQQQHPPSVQELLNSQIRGVEVLLTMFVENAGTRNVLLRPIRANVEAALRSASEQSAAPVSSTFSHDVGASAVPREPQHAGDSAEQ